MDKLRSSRMDVPPKPKNNGEIPQKDFGTVSYPTLEELRQRQAAQMKINDRIEVCLPCIQYTLIVWSIMDHGTAHG